MGADRRWWCIPDRGHKLAGAGAGRGGPVRAGEGPQLQLTRVERIRVAREPVHWRDGVVPGIFEISGLDDSADTRRRFDALFGAVWSDGGIATGC